MTSALRGRVPRSNDEERDGEGREAESRDRGPRRVHVLLDQVSFTGAAAEKVLAQARQLTQARGVKLVLHSPRRTARTSRISQTRLLRRQSLDGHEGDIVGLTPASARVRPEHVVT